MSFLLLYSDAIDLCGALLRISKGLNARVEIVIPDGCHGMWNSALGEWERAVGVARVWSASHWARSAAEWELRAGCIWRGSVGIIERKVKRQKL